MADEIREQLETLYWWGVPTFFRAPHDEDPANCDIGVLGIPHSSGNGSTERDQHLGPRAVRGVSSHNRRPHRTYGIHPFDDVRVPVRNLVGHEHAGWYQMNAAPEFERSGVGTFATAKANVERLVSAARDDASLVSKNPSSRYEIADRWIEVQVGFNVAYRVPRLQAAGEDLEQEATVSKLYGSELTQRVAGTGMHLLGLAAQVAPGTRYAKLAGAFQQEYLKATTSTIVGGTAEMQRNLIAQHGLGLPKER